MRKMILASGNEHKLIEIQKIMEDFSIKLIPMKAMGLGDYEIIEDGETFEENSYIKAKAVLDRLGIDTIADDSGLMVDYLDGAPGVYSARFAGEDVTYDDNNKHLLEKLDGVPIDKRTAKFVTVMTVLFKNGDLLVSRGEIEGYIGTEEQGNNGFGYDPLFIVKGLEKSFAQLSEEKKNEISHRARALEDLKKQLTDYLGDANENSSD